MKADVTAGRSALPESARLLNEQQVSERLGVSVASLRRWRLLSRGPRFFKLGSAVRYSCEDVDTWLRSRPTGGDSSTAN
jgi:predicted DNA-binding transcriptional regulator AlpA